ncbi:hypothetical protein CLOM_g10478, partial [Closterium sp. NIES-68]
LSSRSSPCYPSQHSHHIPISPVILTLPFSLSRVPPISLSAAAHLTLPRSAHLSSPPTGYLSYAYSTS